MEIFKKLLKVKSELGKISKDATNPFFKSKYFDINGLLEHVEPLLSKHDLLLLQPIIEGKVISQIIDPETGDKVSSEMELPSLQDPQKLGSAITYYRRYTLQSLLGLQAEDDDANKASRPEAKTYPKHTTPEAPLDLQKLKNKLEACDTLELLASTYKGLTTLEQKLTAKIATELKELLTKKSA
jgi:hypothetical protein